MSRHTVECDQVNELAEDALFYSGEHRIFLTKLELVQKSIGALEEARRIERLRLVTHLEECKQAVIDAEADLARFDEIEAQCGDLGQEILQLVTAEKVTEREAAERIASDAKRAGFPYARPELVEQGEINRMVERRKELQSNGHVSAREAEAI